jgi:hypothetical protein
VYILSFLFVTYIVLLLSAKIYSPFWFHQPVFHIYEIYPKLFYRGEPYIKNKRIATNGIFCDTLHIVTTPISEATDLLWEKTRILLQGHHLDPDAVLNHNTISVLKKQLYGESYLTCYYENKIVQTREPLSFIDVLDKDNLFGVLASRPLIVSFARFPDRNTKLHEFLYICVHDKYKPKNLSRNLIQTHVLQHQTINGLPVTGGYVFQKHTDLCKAVVPLVRYNTYTFVLRDTPIPKLPLHYSIRVFNSTQVNLWRGIYAKILLKYEISLLPEFHFTLEWLKNERYFIYATVYKEENIEHIHGVYIFENTGISWENEFLEKPHMVRLAASVNFGDPSKSAFLFFRGFLNCLNTFLLDKKEFGILEIPCISDNHLILERWREKYELRNSTPSAYYLYNLIYPRSPIAPSQFFIL